MTFFESLVALLAIAVVLLQVSRRLTIPYPTMLAGAGVVLALLPGAPVIGLDPSTALPLFMAPAIVDSAFDFPLGAVWKLWRPLVALAVLAVLLSAAAVAWLGVTMAGLPLFAAVALGAIVAPPDAAAATAILRSVRMPRRSVTVLKGESLLNDASALLLFSAAVSFQNHGGIDGELALRLGIAAPGGVLLGVVLGQLLVHYVRPLVSGTLGGNLFEFVVSFSVWIIADRLGLSAVLCLEPGSPHADHWRHTFETRRAAALPAGDGVALEEWRRVGLAATRRQREQLNALRRAQQVDSDTFLALQEELDFAEVALTREDERQIEES